MLYTQTSRRVGYILVAVEKRTPAVFGFWLLSTFQLEPVYVVFAYFMKKEKAYFSLDFAQFLAPSVKIWNMGPKKVQSRVSSSCLRTFFDNKIANHFSFRLQFLF